MNIDIGNVVTLENNNDYFIIANYNIDNKNYIIGRNERNIGEIILFELMETQIRIIKSKEEINNIIEKIVEIK